MTTIVDGLREIVGTPDFVEINNGVTLWKYDAMLEYFFAVLILTICIASIFKIVKGFFK